MNPDQLFPIPIVPVIATTRVRHDEPGHLVAWLEPRAARRWRPVYFELVELLEAFRAAGFVPKPKPAWVKS